MDLDPIDRIVRVRNRVDTRRGNPLEYHSSCQHLRCRWVEAPLNHRKLQVCGPGLWKENRMTLLLKKRKQTLVSRASLTNISQAFIMVHCLLQPSSYPGSVHESEDPQLSVSNVAVAVARLQRLEVDLGRTQD